MSLKAAGVIEIPGAAGSAFDHGIFDAKSRRVFIAHTAQSAIEVIDPDAGRHIATLPGFPGAAGAVADDGEILVTNRGSASIAWLDATTLKTKSVLNTGARPNGAAIVKRLALGIAACIGDEKETPTLQAFRLNDCHRVKLDLPGRPRWCVTDAAAERLFLCIREPSMILVASLPDLRPVAQWRLPSGGAHGLDIDHARERLYAACDAGDLVEVDSRLRRGHQCLAHRRRAGCDILQSSYRACPCRDRRTWARGDRRSQSRQIDPDVHRPGRAHHGAGAAGSALCDFTGAWWSSCIGGHIVFDLKLQRRSI